MISGRQLGEQNVVTFAAWIASKTDDEFRDMAIRGVLSRREIAKECGFAKSALDQNPRIKLALRELEESLRKRGVLPQVAERDDDEPQSPLMRDTGHLRAKQDTERLSRLEQENASLRAELAEVKRVLEKFTLLRDALANTGRLPR